MPTLELRELWALRSTEPIFAAYGRHEVWTWAFINDQVHMDGVDFCKCLLQTNKIDDYKIYTFLIVSIL